MSWRRLFLRSRKGSIAPLAAIMMTAAVAAGAGALKVANIYRARESMQQAADAAALAAARSYDAQRDQTGAISLANRVLQQGVPKGFALEGAPQISVGLDSATRVTKATVKATVTDKTAFMRLPSLDPLKANVSAEAVMGGYRDLYLVMMLDVTGSMSPLIASAKAAMTGLEAQLRAGMARNGQSFAKLYIKVAFFRDLRADGSMAWYETRVYDMSQLSEQTALTAQIGAQYATGGADTPESSPAAIAYALTAPLDPKLDPGNTFQLIAVWTDAPGIPLGESDLSYATSRLNGSLSSYGYTDPYSLTPKYDDYTINLWKSFASTGVYPPSTSISESNYLRTSSYGCCTDMKELEKTWRNGGTVKSANRALALFAPMTAYPWREMSTWPSAELSDYLTASTSSSALINGLIGSLSSMSVNLRVSR